MKKRNQFSLALLGLMALSISSCAEKEDNNTINEPSPFATVSDKMTFKVDTLYTEFESPWGMTWLPDGRMLVVERKGEILVFKNDQFTGEKLTGVPETREVNQAGMLDITLHPDYANNGWLYLAYSRPEGDGDVLVISRAKLDGNNMHSVEEIFVCGPEWKGGRHFGS
ncbi:PQQ-dependent sugar dehydrogenase, partial [Cecembia sp.]